MFTTSHMDRRLGYLGHSDDAEVDALLSQLGDASLLKLKVNTHNTSSRVGFEYPTFTDGWVDDDATEALDTQLSSRFSSLKRPVAPAVSKMGKDSVKVGGKKGSNSLVGGGKNGNNNSRDTPTFGNINNSSRESQLFDGKKGNNSRDAPTFGHNNNSSSRESQLFDRMGRGDSCGMGWKGSEGEEPKSSLSSKPSSGTSSRRREVDGAGSKRQQQHPSKKDASRMSSQRTEFYSFRSSDDHSFVAAADEDDEDLDSMDAVLNERFRALKAPPTGSSSTSSSTPPPSFTGNLDLDDLIQISGQLCTNDYESYGSSFSTPASPSPSTNLLGRSKSRSSPRVMTNSVVTSCHCSAPSPLKLLKQVGSKSFPSKQQLSPGSLPPLSPSVKKVGRKYKVEGFGNSKPADNEKNIMDKKEKSDKERKSSTEEINYTSPSTMKDMRRLLSSVADRVGLERSRVSSAVDDELFPEENLNVWSVMNEEQEFVKASADEEQLNREAARVVEWAKDAARLGTGDSDLDSEVDDLGVDGKDDDEDDEDSNAAKPSKKEKPKKKDVKVSPKKKWGLF